MRILAPLSYMAIIIAFSSVPGDIDPQTDGPSALFLWVPPAVQNLVHLPVFGGLALTWRWALSGWAGSERSLSVYAFLATGIFGLLDELYQASVPGRYPTFTDAALDAAGALCALWLIAMLK